MIAFLGAAVGAIGSIAGAAGSVKGLFSGGPTGPKPLTGAKLEWATSQADKAAQIAQGQQALAAVPSPVPPGEYRVVTESGMLSRLWPWYQGKGGAQAGWDRTDKPSIVSAFQAVSARMPELGGVTTDGMFTVGLLSSSVNATVVNEFATVAAGSGDKTVYVPGVTSQAVAMPAPGTAPSFTPGAVGGGTLAAVSAGIAGLPVWGIVLGAVVVGGVLFFAVRR